MNFSLLLGVRNKLMLREGKKKEIKKVLADLKLFALINWPVQSNYMLITRVFCIH